MKSILTAAECDASSGLLGMQLAIAAAMSFGAVGPDSTYMQYQEQFRRVGEGNNRWRR